MKKSFQTLAFGSLCVFASNYILAQDAEFKLTLRDGNIISGTSSKISNICLQTDYGKLEIPIKNISSIELGITPSKEKDKIIMLLKQLSNSNEQMRSGAYNELLKKDIGAIPVINDFMFSEQYTPDTVNSDYTVDNVLNELKNTFQVKDNFSEKDLVVIESEYSMGGSFDMGNVDLKTSYGPLSIPKSKIEKIEVVYTPTSGNGIGNFTLMANKHISSNYSVGWLKTGIMVKQGQRVSISAKGVVAFASLSGNKYKPDGTVVNGAATSTPAVDDYSENSSTGDYPSYGNVVYKIGESGEAMKAGAKFNGSMQSNGMLYISIYETVYNAANTGFYNVTINAK